MSTEPQSQPRKDPMEPQGPCCTPKEQEACCKPEDKAACCGDAAKGGSCGCR
jgi:hypothetical protein